MADDIKFTEEELKSLGELQNSYTRITNAFGQITISRSNLDLQEEALKDELETTRQNEQTILSGITEKYGPGSLDPQTGVFTPTTEVQPTEEEK